jgi:hypothetical protein
MAGCEPDYAPKHIIAVGDGTQGGTDIYWHFDCHVLASNCATCTESLKEVGGAGSKGLKNDKLLDHLLEKSGAEDDR